MEGASLLVNAVIYLSAGVIAVPIATRLGLGSVLGYLIAGAIIGPYAWGLVADQQSVLHFAEFGVVIMLFLIGLEVRPSILWSMRRSFFGLGGAQVLVSGAVLGAIALALGLFWQEAFALGFILALSSTAIVLQTLEERHLRQTATGTASFAILLFQDLSIIPMFALVPLLAASHGGSAMPIRHGVLAGYPAGIRALGVIAAVGLIIAVGYFLVRPVFRFIANTRQREIFTAAALLLVVAVALLMQAVGQSAALGAFLAGVVLAESEFRREIEADIEPFRGLLLGLFFISIGASVNLQLVAHHPVLLACVVPGAMIVKAVVIFVIARASGSDTRTAAHVGVALSQGGEFAFVLLGIVSAADIMTRDVAALATVGVAVSMALTPVALIAFERLSARPQAAQGPAPEDEAFDLRPDALIAGFGRFGQIVGRLLIVNGFRTSTLEASAEQVALMRRFGRRVNYGDATRLALLRAAGAADAKLLVVAIDDRDAAERLVEVATRHFPHLKILARAYDRRHAYRLLDKGADIVERETFEAGLKLGEEALKSLGFEDHLAARARRLFRLHDEEMFRALETVWKDEERYVIATRETSARMQELLAADLEEMRKEQHADIRSPN
ncbi:monovalent cation:proton antiporter-2 (CPA2) family protein [Pararobbsia silviterrae]|uniref:Potassium transporter n=1 Tax=Pararobbsia silviterrae TaxID=1792498 RepID=A0A494X7J6_9BURK|nr:monovalent cation:proton antiporter-2 (CPA2) family protein [Pararobbsia silviterrae]RKP46548.1 potassium transporter [Pararobbsia silviterrae]